MIRLLAWWALLTGLYYGLISSVAGWELALGVGLGALAAAVAVLTHSAEGTRYRPAAGWWRWLVVLPAAIVRGTWLLTVVVAQRLVLRRDVRGHFRRVQLPLTGSDDRDAARRALAAVALAATPSTVVADVDEAGVVLLHELGPAGSRLEALVTR